MGTQRTLTLGVAALALSLVGLDAGRARAAEEDPTRVGMLDFTGTQAAGVRQWVSQRLRTMKEVAVVPRTELPTELPAVGDAAALVTVATEAELCAAVRGELVGKGGKWTLTLTVLDGGTGRTLETMVFESTWIVGVKKELDASLVERFAGVVGTCQTPAEAKAKAEAEAEAERAAALEEEADDEGPSATPRESESKPEKKSAPPRPSSLEVELGPALFTRRLSYQEDVTTTLRSYRLKGVAPGVHGALTWYPVAHVRGGPLAHLGLTGRYFRGFPAAAEREGRTLATSTQSYRGGLRVRIPVAPVEVGLLAEYGGHDYRVDRDPITGTVVVPDARYRFVRPGAAVRLGVGAFAAELTGGARIVLSTGDLESAVFFPELTGNGWDGGLAAGATFGVVTLLAQGGLELYRFALHPSAENASPYGVAGAAVDQGYSGGLVVRFTTPSEAKP